MLDPARELDVVDGNNGVKKTTTFHKVENFFSISFLQNSLSKEISNLVKLQRSIVNSIDMIIKRAKEPFMEVENNE